MKIKTIAKQIISLVRNLYFRAEYYFEARKSYAVHLAKGGSTQSRLTAYPELNWSTSKLPSCINQDRLAFFVAYHPGREAPISNLNYVETLANCGFRVVYIHNGPLAIRHRLTLESICERVICRKNIGQDFGAWKDCILSYHFDNQLEDLKWLLLCNDSNFFISCNQKEFKSRLTKALENEQNELIALNKNLDYWDHYQSYFLCFGRSLFLRSDFLRFWQRYMPLDHRFHAINNGEVALTREIIKSANTEILYEPIKLYAACTFNMPSTHDCYSLVPKRFWSQVLRSISPGEAQRIITKNELIKILAILETFNPSHALAIFFIRYCYSPFLKKDLIKQGSFSLSQITDLLLSQGIIENSPEWTSIVRHYMDQGLNISHKRYPKNAYRKGINTIRQNDP